MSEVTFQERRDQIVLFRFGGVAAATCAAWLSAVDRAEREGRSVPSWPELEAISSSLNTDGRAAIASLERKRG